MKVAVLWLQREIRKAPLLYGVLLVCVLLELVILWVVRCV